MKTNSCIRKDEHRLNPQSCFGIVVAILLAVALIPLPAFADDTSTSQAASTDIPSSYDMRDYGLVTSVKNQKPFGTCWGFGAVAASESSILSDSGASAEDVDLSERHLAWFAANHIPDDHPGGQGGEGAHLSRDGEVSTSLASGGSFITATSVFSSGVGPVSESDDPEWAWTKYRNEEGLEYSENGVPLYYSEEGDWSIDEEYRFLQSYQLEETSILPSPAGRDENGNYQYNSAATDIMKQEMLEGRAVALTIRSDPSTLVEGQPPQYINRETWAHYTYEPLPPNHMVTVVGWDDSYSRTNFNEEHQPPADGAWLIKNSWGSQTEDFPNGGDWGLEDENGNHTGYYWASYYDQSITQPETFEYMTTRLESQPEYYLINQYDYLVCGKVAIKDAADKTSMANIFTAEEDQAIRSLSVETNTPNTKVTLELYQLDDGFTNPRDGQLLETITKTFEWGGYHRMDLATTHPIQEGAQFSVVATLVTDRGTYEYFTDTAPNKKFSEYLVAEYGPDMIGGYYKGVVNEGESFLYSDGEWTDWTQVIPVLQAETAQGDFWDYDNFGLKAYADPIHPTASAVDAFLFSTDNNILLVLAATAGTALAFALIAFLAWRVCAGRSSKRG